MAKYKMVALTNSVPGREDEYNRWHSDVHIIDVLSVEGLVRGQRFVLTPSMGSEDWKYLAIYDIETEDIEQVKRSLLALGGTAEISDALESSSVTMWFAEPIGAVTEP